MANLIKGAEPAKIMAGDKQVKRKYIGNKLFYVFVARHAKKAWGKHSYVDNGLALIDGTLYAVNENTNMLETVDINTGEKIKQISTDEVSDVATNNSGMLAYGNDSVHVLNIDGSQRFQFMLRATPYLVNRLALAPNGAVMFDCYELAGGSYGKQSYIYDDQGNYLKSISDTGAVCADDDNNFYQQSNTDQKLRKYDDSGNELWAVDCPYYFDRMIFANNQLYATDTSYDFHILDTSGNNIKNIKLSNLAGALAKDDLGYIYVSSYDGNVYKFDKDGNQIWQFNTGLTEITNMVADENTVYVEARSIDETFIKLIQF